MNGTRIPIAIALCLAVPAAALCRTIVVAPNGNDGGPGTAESPLRTISHAADAAMPGDTILVRAGIYRERVTPPRGGTPADRRDTPSDEQQPYAGCRDARDQCAK